MDKRSEIFKKIEEIQKLPTLPAVIGKLNAALENPNVNALQVGKIINDDPSIMTKILKTVNSAIYSLPNPVTSIAQATSLLGFRTIKNIAMATSVFTTFKTDEKNGRFNREEFWKHSIMVGIGMNVLYKFLKTNLKKTYDPDTLHLAGLVHGIGIIIFEQFFHVKFTFALQAAMRENVSLVEAEKESLGADHCEVGAWLAKKWNLPQSIIECVRWHYEPENASEEHAELVKICHTAKYICTLNKLGDYGDSTPIFKPFVWKALGLSMEDIGDIIDEINNMAGESETLLAIMKS